MTQLPFLLGIAGLLTTLISSGLGLYFVHRARTAVMRDLLYGRQLDLATKVSRLLSRMQLMVVMISAPDAKTLPEYADRAREELEVLIPRLARLTPDAALLFPVELFGELQGLSRVLGDFSQSVDDGKDVSGAIDDFNGRAAKIMLLARTALGIEPLSEERMRLFAKAGSLSSLAEMDPHEFVAMAAHEDVTDDEK